MQRKNVYTMTIAGDFLQETSFLLLINDSPQSSEYSTAVLNANDKYTVDGHRDEQSFGHAQVRGSDNVKIIFLLVETIIIDDYRKFSGLGAVLKKNVDDLRQDRLGYEEYAGRINRDCTQHRTDPV